MTCNELVRAIDAYLDDELSVMDILRLHGHLLSCGHCHRVMGSEAALHSLLAEEAARDRPPGALRERIIQRVAAEEQIGRSGTGWEARPRPGPFVLLSAVLAAAALVGLLVLIPWMTENRKSADLVPLAAEVAAKHLLYSGGLGSGLEITTSQASALTQWVERRIGLPLKLPELDQADARLVGGRVSSLADAPAAYLLYQRGGRHISLFVTRSVPGASVGGSRSLVDGAELSTSALRGVVLAWWEEEDEGRLYAAASTGDANELREFAVLCIRSGNRVKPD
jgi:mycothiol system anti-sigma-R factor